MMKPLTPQLLSELTLLIKQWGQELGFAQVGISDIHLSAAENHLHNWLENGFHGEMAYMHKHGLKRSRPELLQEGTRSVISVRMDYLPEPAINSETILNDPLAAFISRYALGRDYHKVLRNRLQTLAEKIQAEIGSFGYRAFVDSAPVLEKALAEKAGLGWIGKHSNLINRQTGSWFFLGEIYTDLPLPADNPSEAHCGKCVACLNICPTQAIVAPYQVDARRCISYLTIELHGAIPLELRPLIGNRIYGCDDCQLICPWNRFAKLTKESDFNPRYNLNSLQLIEAFSWNESEFLRKMEGSAIRRIGHQRWLRNIAVALGNAKPSTKIKQALLVQQDHASELVREHVLWALTQQTKYKLKFVLQPDKDFMIASNDAYLDISIARQQLSLIHNNTVICSYPVSTAKNGVGQLMGSDCTPTGWHRIRAKIGDGQPINSVFIGRRATGEVYSLKLAQQQPERDWILTRILWLGGLEPHKNRYGKVDTSWRYIYIHGSPDHLLQGKPESHGCIRMKNADLIDLFAQVSCQTRVYIHL